MASTQIRNEVFMADRAETVLERIPTFNLVLVAGSPAERDLLPRLIKSLFGVADIDLATQTLVPQTPRSNSRITIVTAPSTATAREYLHAHQTATADDSRAVHAVWVVLGSTEGAQVAQDDLKFGAVPTLLLSASPTKAPSGFAKWATALRLSGVPNDLISVDVSDTKSLADLSKRMETALISTPDLRLVWVAAQRVSGDEKIATSIRKGMKLFSVAVGASAQPIPFIGGATGVGALGLLQSDIVAVYNFEDPGKVLLSKTVLNTLWEVATGLPVKWLVSAVGLSVVSGLWEAPGSARTIMMAIADLVLVLDALFYTQSQRPTGQPITADEVKAIIRLYEKGRSKEAGAGVFRRDLVHDKLGTENIGRFAIWKSLKRQEAQQHLTAVIEQHRYRG